MVNLIPILIGLRWIPVAGLFLMIGVNLRIIQLIRTIMIKPGKVLVSIFEEILQVTLI